MNTLPLRRGKGRSPLSAVLGSGRRGCSTGAAVLILSAWITYEFAEDMRDETSIRHRAATG